MFPDSDGRVKDFEMSSFSLADADSLENSNLVYGGRACNKLGVVYGGKDYLLKFPGNLKNRNFKNVVLSYSNSPVCEYIGSHIFQMIGMDAHHTLLAKRGGKTVVLCEDFTGINITLQEFSDIKTTFEPSFLDKDGNLTNGDGARLSEILLVLKQHPFYQRVPEAIDFFWRMFIVDAFIGNQDRNNGNWGLLYDRNKQQHFVAPVYDNGNCLNDKWDEDKMLKFLSRREDFQNIAWKAYTCYQLNDSDKRLNPFQVIESGTYLECSSALVWVLERINMDVIYKFIDYVTVLSEIQRQFYKELLLCRYEYLNYLRGRLCI